MLGMLKDGVPSPLHKKFTSTVTDIAPGKQKAVPLGSYLKSEPSPTFDLAVDNDMMDFVGASLERQDITGTPRYVMFYQLHNYGDKPCRVTVRRRTRKVAA